MQKIKIVNKTSLTDFSALFRVALYLFGDKEQAEDEGILIKDKKNVIHRTITVTEGFGEMKNRVSKKMIKGAAISILVSELLVGAIVINAAWADTELPEEYISYCEEIGQAYHICPELIEAVIEKESGGDPDAVGELGEIGLMQVYPKYHMVRAEHLGVYNLFDPQGNILVGTDYLAELFKEYEDICTVLMIYNGTEDARERGRKGNYTNYAKRIMKRAEQLERIHTK